MKYEMIFLIHCLKKCAVWDANLEIYFSQSLLLLNKGIYLISSFVPLQKFKYILYKSLTPSAKRKLSD